MKLYAAIKKNVTKWQDFSDPEDFNMMLSDFLYSSVGARYKRQFRFRGTLECNKPAPPIAVSFQPYLGPS